MEIYVQSGSSAPAVIDRFSSFRWRRKYYDIGEFELHVPNTYANRSVLFAGVEPLVWFRGSVEKGFVTDISVDQKEIAASGIMETGVAKKYVLTTAAVTVDPANAIGAIWNKHPGNTYERRCPLIGETVPFAYEDGIESDILTKIARAYNLGFYAVGNKMIIYKGTDRTASQADNSHAVFFEDDLQNPIWTRSTTNYYTRAKVVGKDGVLVEVGNGDKQLYVNNRTLDNSDYSAAEYQNILRQKGKEALDSHPIVDNVEASLSQASRLKYGEDWFLGDVVSLKIKEWGIEIDKRITEVEEVFEAGKHLIYPVFGDPLPERLEL